MMLRMRTTVRIDDELYARVRTRAAETGRSIGEVIEDALRIGLAPQPGTGAEVGALPVFEGTGVMPGVDLTSNAGLADVMDEGAPVDAVR